MMKRKRVDLHVHSGYSSDGTFGVHELFAQAKELHMEGLVIADHDTWEAWEEAEQESELTGIRTIPALELSCVEPCPSANNGNILLLRIFPHILSLYGNKAAQQKKE